MPFTESKICSIRHNKCSIMKLILKFRGAYRMGQAVLYTFHETKVSASLRVLAPQEKHESDFGSTFKMANLVSHEVEWSFLLILILEILRRRFPSTIGNACDPSNSCFILLNWESSCYKQLFVLVARASRLTGTLKGVLWISGLKI